MDLKNVSATILTDDMEKIRHGTLVLHQDSIWYFHMGRGSNRIPIQLTNLHEDIFKMIKTCQLKKGHPSFHRIFKARRQLRFETFIARHIPPASLDQIDASTLLNQSQRPENMER